MSLRRILQSLPVLVIATALPLTAVLAQTTGCPGKDLLGELKMSDAAVHARILAAANASKNGKRLLWKIESHEQPDHPASYLFGTLNVSDERLQHFSTAVTEALDVSSRIALEVDETSPERTQEALGVMRNATVPGNSAKLETLLARPDAARASLILARSGLPKDLAARVKPWVAMLLTSTSECERERLRQGKLTLDAELARQAENRGVGSFGLESTEMQYAAFAALSDAEQISLLKAGLAAVDHIDDETEAMVQLYLAHDIGALWPLHEELGKRYGADAPALEAFRQSVLDDRNVRMRDRTLMHLATGGVFIAVGAMHLPGDKGLVELFKDAGYKLTAIE